MGASKHTGGFQTYRGCIQINVGIQTYWGCPNIWEHPNIQEGVQTYGGVKHTGGHPNILGYSAKQVLPLVLLTVKIRKLILCGHLMGHDTFAKLLPKEGLK